MDLNIIIMILSALLMSFLLAPFYLKWLKNKQFGQFIREDGPKAHLKKSGTPTMGALIFLLPVVILSCFFVDYTKIQNLALLILILIFGFIGGVDDFAKITKKQNEGLTSKQKIVLQFSGAAIFYLILQVGNVDTNVYVPIVNQTIDLGSILYTIFVMFLIVGASNATNLTDGLDGLLAGNAIVSFSAFAFIAHLQGNQTVFAFAILFIVTLLVFLMFNFNPAKVFMGDTGSLALGAVMAGMAIILKVEVLLLFIGMIYVIETLSVIMQVTSFKLTGKRIFKMSPIHHHFELVGLSEKQVFSLFVITQVLFSIVSVILIMKMM
ncbi:MULTISPECIES: phospho-N-acetylmuramoyl-pentapeptide-transferase [Bacillus cereus group]|uniref:phospho-N-acetylmuramoyl-pentapeptide- transferase n=1 Tax=Bacillus cereus group TaxID=86661 RepID=UPI0021002A6C|nr:MULTISPECIES: phospho-N-acetylmuramoyl-pentapeptide-transferase [Bacillus cereus group]